METRPYPKGRRILCFIIDIVIIFTISLILVRFAVKPILGFNEDNYTTVKNNILDDLNRILQNEEISRELLNYDIEMYFRYFLVDSLAKIITFFLISSIYLVIIPVFCKQKTLGRLITKLKIINMNGEDIKNSKLIKRELLATFLFYFLSYVFLGFLLIFISLIVCAVSGRSLIDKMTKTMFVDDDFKLEDDNIIDAKVEEIKEENNDYSNVNNNNYNNDNNNDNYYNNDNDNHYDNDESSDSDDEYKVF